MAVSNETFMIGLLLIGIFVLFIKNKRMEKTPIGNLFVGLILWISTALTFLIFTGDYQLIALTFTILGFVYFVHRFQRALALMRANN